MKIGRGEEDEDEKGGVGGEYQEEMNRKGGGGEKGAERRKRRRGRQGGKERKTGRVEEREKGQVIPALPSPLLQNIFSMGFTCAFKDGAPGCESW